MMTTPIPQKKTIIDEIIERAPDGHLSDFDHARFTKKAEALKRNDPSTAYSALGVLACLRKDLGTCRKAHEASLKIAPHSGIMWYNYAISVWRLDETEEAFGYIVKAHQFDPMNPLTLSALISIAYEAYELNTLEAALKDWLKLMKKPHEIEAKYLNEAPDERAHDLSRECSIASEDVLARIWNTPEEDAAWVNL